MDWEGHCEPGFEPVGDTFAANFSEHGDIGAACAVWVDGRPAVDIWGGLADSATGRPWTADTLQLVFSTTKGATAICARLLVQRGLLDLDAPVADYWPEFSANGKGAISVRWVLSRRAGLAAIEGTFTLDEALSWDPVVDALAAQPPNWEPGTAHGYHMRSYGWLVGELVRRIDGRTLGRFFADEVAAPLGLQFWIGLPESEEPRVSTIVPPPPPPDRRGHSTSGSPDPTPSSVASSQGRPGSSRTTTCGTPAQCTPPSSRRRTASPTTRSVARMYTATVGEVDGVRLLDPDTVAGASEPQVDGPDKVIMYPTRRRPRR